MGRFIYRMCLVIVVAIAVAGGVYSTFYQKEDGPHKGTFVYTDESAKNTAREISLQAGQAVKEASVQAQKAVKEVSAQAGQLADQVFGRS